MLIIEEGEEDTCDVLQNQWQDVKKTSQTKAYALLPQQSKPQKAELTVVSLSHSVLAVDRISAGQISGIWLISDKKKHFWNIVKQIIW